MHAGAVCATQVIIYASQKSKLQHMLRRESYQRLLQNNTQSSICVQGAKRYDEFESFDHFAWIRVSVFWVWFLYILVVFYCGFICMRLYMYHVCMYVHAHT
jgi:hypothetical protein